VRANGGEPQGPGGRGRGSTGTPAYPLSVVDAPSAQDLPPLSGPDGVPVRGRARPPVEVALRRLEASWALRGCAVAAFVAYGGLGALVLAGRLPFVLAGVAALLSLASWFFLLWWYPVMERTLDRLGRDPRRVAVGRILEGIAVACVVVVHVLLVVIVVYTARS